MSKYISPTALITAMVGLGQFDQPQPQQIPFLNRKQITKRSHAKVKRPGRGRPAKGYDPETKTWSKP